MSTRHDTLSLEFQTAILAEIKKGKAPWSSVFSREVVLVSNSDWPLTDGIIKDEHKKIQCGVEFKPPGQNKREYLTGLGQAIAYLDKNEFALYLLPEKSDDGFDIGAYIGSIVNSGLFVNMPLGVITYDENSKQLIRKAIPNVTRTITNKTETNSTFWAFWRELSTDELYQVLEKADELHATKGNIKKPVLAWLNSARVAGSVNGPNGKPRRIGKKSGTETPEQTYRNTAPFIGSLGLWDNQGRLTDDGYLLRKVGKQYGSDSSMFNDELTKFVLKQGNHLKLILLIDEFQASLYKKKKFTARNNNTFNAQLETHLEGKGLLKRAPGRRTTSARKRFQSEITLWGWLNLLEKNGASYFISGVGYKFNWERITKLIGE